MLRQRTKLRCIPSIDGVSTVLWSLEFGAGVLHDFLLINLVGRTVGMKHCRMHAGCTAGATARTNFGLSTGRLAGGEHAEKTLTSQQVS